MRGKLHAHIAACQLPNGPGLLRQHITPKRASTQANPVDYGRRRMFAHRNLHKTPHASVVGYAAQRVKELVWRGRVLACPQTVTLAMRWTSYFQSGCRRGILKLNLIIETRTIFPVTVY
jgi:hypothetical protein